jgi:hypothetical protein
MDDTKFNGCLLIWYTFKKTFRATYRTSFDPNPPIYTNFLPVILRILFYWGYRVGDINISQPSESLGLDVFQD